MILPFRLLLARLNPAFLRAIGLILGLLLLASLFSFGLRSCQRRRLAGQQLGRVRLHRATTRENERAIRERER